MKKLFEESHPILFEELHPTKNTGVDFSGIYENSGRKVWWQCKINSKHVWSQSITNRTKHRYGCPYCSGRLTLPEDSFAELFPFISKELHPTKNGDFDPFTVRPHCNKKVWWECANGHVWQQIIKHRVSRKAGCKKCKKIENSILRKQPEIAKEWHEEKNGSLKPSDVTSGSRLKVWWKCSKDSSHVWQMTIETRIRNKSGCPKCTNASKKGKLPTLDIYDPQLAKQWHPTKNLDLTPSTVTPGMHKKVWWLCPNSITHEWEASINNRVKGRGCPFCAKLRVTPENSLQNRFPEIAYQWHPIKNKNLELSDISYGSSRKVWWQCQKKKSHEWQATVASRTQRNKIDCPFCFKSRFYRTNTLSACHPEIADQWHPTKNINLNPKDVTRASGRLVWWLCPENPEHSWKAQVKNRTVLGAGCPICSREKNIIRLSEHLFDLVHSEIDYYHIFLNNLSALKNLSKQSLKGSKRLKQPYFRMIYSSIITTLETYLSDAFYKKVSNDKELLEKCLETNPEFVKRQYSLTEVIDWHNNLRKRVTDYLFNIIWHNLPKIQNMYKDVLGVNFPEDISHLHRAVALRHDIVHRNGRSKSGYMHKLDKSQLLDLIGEVKDFVSYVNMQLLDKTEPDASPDG
jgi:Probable Zinc-ribbon domain/RiboL-PSP-HEPN